MITKLWKYDNPKHALSQMKKKKQSHWITPVLITTINVLGHPQCGMKIVHRQYNILFSQLAISCNSP